FSRVSKLLPNSSEVPAALAFVTRREGDWNQSIALFTQALAFDPRNLDLLSNTAWTYAMLRQFSVAPKHYDRALDIIPNDPDLTAAKAGVFQAEGELQEASKLLSEINAQTQSENAVRIKWNELRLERNHGEAVRLLQARQTQFHFTSEIDKGVNQVALA